MKEKLLSIIAGLSLSCSSTAGLEEAVNSGEQNACDPSSISHLDAGTSARAVDSGYSADMTSKSYRDMGEEPVTEPCITFEWFLDYQGPFDKRYFNETHHQIIENYGENIWFLYKHFPLSFHPEAQEAAEAAECARLQGDFLSYHTLLFAAQDDWRERPDKFRTYAMYAGLDYEAFGSCLEGRATAPIVDDNSAEGSKRGVSGVPAFFINDFLVSGAQPYAVFSQVIDEELRTCAVVEEPR